MSKYLPARGVCQRYGVSLASLNRRLIDEVLGWPPVHHVVHRQRYWSIAELDAWDARQAAKARPVVAVPAPKRGPRRKAA
jgi:hypothetical protein